jgi:hypothetical protein
VTGLLIWAAGGAAQHSLELQFQCSTITLDSITTDRVRIGVPLTLAASKAILIRQLNFESMRINDLPIYIEPVEETLRLEPYKPLTLRPLQVVIYREDLLDTTVLKHLLERDTVNIRGIAYADAPLPFAAHVLLMTTQSRFAVPIAFDVRLDGTREKLSRVAALAALESVSKVVSATQPILGQADLRSGWQRDAENKYAKALFLVRAEYTVRDQHGESVAAIRTGVGFRTSGKNPHLRRTAAAMVIRPIYSRSNCQTHTIYRSKQIRTNAFSI